MPKPDSSLTFTLRAVALLLLIEHHGKWQRNLDLGERALSHSYESVKNNKVTEKFDPPVYSVPLVKCGQCASSNCKKPRVQAWKEAPKTSLDIYVKVEI